MTHLARLGKSTRHVVRIGSPLEVRQVAGHACRTREVIATILRVVTVRALSWWNGVRAGQREIHQRMIKRCRGPRRRRMALGTVGGEVGCHMVGIGRTLEIFQVATNASCRSQVVIVVGVAISTQARGNGMPSAQGKSHRIVIELCTQPVVRAVTVAASRGEHGRDMVRVARSLELFGVAGKALRRHRLEVAGSRAFMTGIAVDGRMSASQGKAVVVLLDLRHRHLPAQHRMALLAVGSQLPAVNVGVAVLAPLADVGEHRFDMALCTGHGLMHATQRILRLIVVEFRNGANRTPGRCRVAVLAGRIQISVRTMCSSCRLCSRARSNPNKKYQQPDPIVHAPDA